MTNKGKKLEPPLSLGMDFGEALSRFAVTDPEEVQDGIEMSKKKKPPRDGPPRRPARVKRGKPAAGRKRKPANDKRA